MRLYRSPEEDGSLRTIALDRSQIRPEATLETILHANPQLIIDEQLLVIGRQVRLDAGVADLVACDQFGNVVVCEVKIGRSGSGSASEETILSQPQTYARALSSYSYDDLDDLYQDYLTRLRNGEWDVDLPSELGGTLVEDFESTFGTTLSESEFNVNQRLVVVAEEVTKRTAANARYLLEQGLDFQCTEVGQFVPSDGSYGHAILASSTVVDYDLSRVRPKRRASPTYPDLVQPIVQQVFPSIVNVVHARSLDEVFPDGLDQRGPGLVSQNPDHPDGVLYYVSPEPDADRVTIGLHNMNENPEVGELIQESTDRFEQAGLTVQDNVRYNLLWKRWSVESSEDVRELQDEIAEHYGVMIRLGHDVLTEPSTARE